MPSDDRLQLDARRRSCTITLHGPWGTQQTPVFVRVAFEFPKAYPSDPLANPSYDIDKSPLIPPSNRTRMVEGMQAILAEHQRRPLEACLSFLRFGARYSTRPPSPHDALDDSSEEEENANKNIRPVASMLRNHKNLGEPRTSQGVFSPNGWPNPFIVHQISS
jgi:hypothetical protein